MAVVEDQDIALASLPTLLLGGNCECNKKVFDSDYKNISITGLSQLITMKTCISPVTMATIHIKLSLWSRHHGIHQPVVRVTIKLMLRSVSFIIILSSSCNLL